MKVPPHVEPVKQRVVEERVEAYFETKQNVKAKTTDMSSHVEPKQTVFEEQLKVRFQIDHDAKVSI
jgi:hypothetical protein